MAFGVGKSRSRVSNAYYLRVHYSKLRAPSPSPSPSTLLRRFAMQMSTKLRERGNFPLTCCVWVRYCGRRLGTAANCCDNCTFEARKNCQTFSAADFAVLININCMHSNSNSYKNNNKNKNTNMLLPCLCISSAVLTTCIQRHTHTHTRRHADMYTDEDTHTDATSTHA